MNRVHAEHILDAYTDMHRECGSEDACVESLREVILDAMTGYKPQMISASPGITLPVDNTPKVTWTGYDPLYGTPKYSETTTKLVGE
jgi:hypothetical protein